MKIYRLALLALVGVVSSSALGSTLWYNGDFDGRNGGNVGGFSGFDSRVYDDFNVSGAGWNVNSVFMNVLWAGNPADIQTFSWEIRQNVTTGSGGSLVASGTGGTTVNATGRSGFGYTEYTVTVNGLNVNLGAGTYWLGGKVGGAGTSNSIYVTTTSGTNAIGSPAGNNGNSYWDSTSFGQVWQPTTALFGSGTWDLSMGVAGSPVPEPASMAALGIGALALIRRRNRKA